MADLPEELVARCVRPFYMAMMGENARSSDINLGELAKVVASITDDEVVALLSSDWRPRVMGAWLSAGRTGELVEGALLRSLETSRGLLTSPALATVAVLNVGEFALPSLYAYLAMHLEHHWGEPGFIVAAIEYVDGSAGTSTASDEDRSHFMSMLAVGKRIGELRSGV